MKTNKLFLIYILMLFTVNRAFSQVSIGGLPYSFQMDKNIDANIPTVSMPPIDVNKLLKEDKIDEQNGLPWRFGKDIDTNLSLLNSGVWIDLENGDRIWKLKIKSQSAHSINLIYSDFFLPEGGNLYIYSLNREDVIGGFTKNNNKPSSKFATSLVQGDVCILEYYEPKVQKGKGRITISKVIHGYKNLLNEKAYGGSGSCNNNVNCTVGANWQDDKRSVAMVLLSNNTRWCSGALVNNAEQNGIPYFLTANHCYSNDVESWIFMFNYESPSCANQNGPTNQTVTGSTVRARNADTDFLLLELSVSPPDNYNAFYAGWTRQNIASSSSVGIHHPSGDIKKISFDYDPPVSSAYPTPPSVANSHWTVQNWDDGTTEGGSSGSPLFDQNHRIIGQLHGGYASCFNNLQDYYGKFSMSWDRGSSSSTRLKDWLDPSNTGLVAIDGAYFSSGSCPISLNITQNINSSQTFKASNTISASSTIAPNINVTFQAGSLVELLPGFYFAPGTTGNFIAKIEDCSVSANLSYNTESPEYGIQENIDLDNSSSNRSIVYPNPTKDKISIVHPFETNINYSITIYDFKGKLVFKGDYNNNNIEVELKDLIDGLYTLNLLFSDGQRISTNIIIKR